MMQTGVLAERISRITVSSTMRIASEAERLRRSGEDVVDLGVGEPDFPTPANIKQAAIRAIESDFTKYTAAGGTLELRQAVCQRHAASFGAQYAPANCVISVGGKHVVFNAIQALVDPGDEVVIPVPYWVTFKDVVNYAGGRCVFAPTSEENGFQLTAATLEPWLSNRTKAVIVNSPCNPSGAIVDPAEFERILHLTARRGAYLISDECYCQFVYDGEPYSIASAQGAQDNVIVAGSVSKTYAMTGWRIGFALAPQPVADAMAKLQSHSTSNPTSIAQKAAVEALCGPQDSVAAMLAEYRRRRAFVIERLRHIPGVTCAEPKGAFYAYPNISAVFRPGGVENTVEFAERLLGRMRVAVVPGEAFGTENHVRISYATSMRELERGLDRFEQFVTSLLP
jgi:aspartate aminotransferase